MFFIGLAGIALLYAGGEILVKYSSTLGAKLGLSDLIIGLTIVAFGTSAPELVSSVIAILKGASGLVVGNVLGSNITNIGLILALSALISPFGTDFERNRKDFIFLAAASTLAGVVMFTGHISWWEGMILLGLFLIYNWSIFRSHAGGGGEPERSTSIRADLNGLLPSLVGIILAIVLLPSGANLLVDSATGIGRELGVSEHIMGLTLVAVGTSLPELVTSLIAAFHRKGDLCLGNIIGSNIFNILVVPGICSILAPMDFMSELLRTDIMVMLGISLAAIVLASSGSFLSRREGTFLLTCYAGYLFSIAS
jgi:cation:H+ antiporter